MSVLVVLGGAGGIVIALSAITVLGRGIFRLVAATEENTQAVKLLSADVSDLRTRLSSQEIRLAVLEDRNKRGGHA